MSYFSCFPWPVLHNRGKGPTETLSSSWATTTSSFKLHLRSFAPFESFGGGFEGDNRKHSADPCKPARVIGAVTFNPLTGAVIRHEPFSYESKHSLLGTATAKPTERVGAIRTGRAGIYVQLDLAAANPLVKPAPTIDLHLQVEASIAARALNLSASLSGDAFPNAEVFVEDYTGRRRMLGTFSTSGGRQLGPMTLLWGDTRRFMTGVCTVFEIDGTGRFL